MFSSSYGTNLQNRALQKSSIATFFQKLQLGVSSKVNIKKSKLSKDRVNNANYIRNRKLATSLSIAAVLILTLLYFGYKWVTQNPITF